MKATLQQQKEKEHQEYKLKIEQKKSQIIVQMKSPNLKESLGTGIENKQNLIMI